ncbi:uncharacterized protein B0I36DRAFT_16407 [Microdochium trichocladiopsis]|uniref:Transglycosylase SLT domain-containing protein n=1 Tax=Microdochium trichocladiopsis TaxID=1682393 RepID=A0A9P8YI11_9PEZI|nr:uncharacterized protein B0I36DRAFT_16407 [Microdochium trichocladiopsis]KAH7040881.1 hypothetical protein B0I36DRAFT_16407 [Microdochium trichocladiopsis]
MAFIKNAILALAATASLTTAAVIAPREGVASNETTVASESRVSEKTGVSIMSAPQWYSGPWYNYPTNWLGWEDLWQRNDDMIRLTGSTWDDVGRINVAIWEASNQYSVDPRVILVIIMQESHGYVGVRTTYSYQGIPTAGLMQCSGCAGFPGQTNLPQEWTTEMIMGGTAHFRGNLDNWGGNGWEAWCVYPALREYNSGQVNWNDLSDPLGATPEYVSDVSQRLGGWYD